jgi:hypothetical protein
LPSEITRYAIADYLSEAQRQTITSRRYRPTYVVNGRPVVPRCAEGRCPLGALTAAPEPLAVEIAEALSVPAHYRTNLYIACRQFMRDWDDGRIPPDRLAAALGMEAPDAD